MDISKPGIDRRTIERDDCEVRMSCFYKGARLKGNLKNSSARGGFFEVKKIIQPNQIVVLEEIQQFSDGPPNHLVARVARFAMVPDYGVGVEWLRAVAPGGVDALMAFMESHLGLEIPYEQVERLPASQRDQEVFWDFKLGTIRAMDRQRAAGDKRKVSMFGVAVREDILEQLGQVQIVQSEAPKQKRANLSKEASVDSRSSEDEGTVMDQARALRLWMSLIERRKKADIPARAIKNNKRRKVTILSMDSQGMFLQYRKHQPEEGDRLMIEAELPIEKNRYEIRFILQVNRLLYREDIAAWGAECRILSVTEGGFRGIYNQYLRS